MTWAASRLFDTEEEARTWARSGQADYHVAPWSPLDWITDLDQVDWWTNDADNDTIGYDIVQAKQRRNVDEDGNPTDDAEPCAVIPLPEARELLRRAGYRFHAAAIDKWVTWDLERADRDRAFIAENGFDAYAAVIEASHAAQRAHDEETTES